jgi:DNA invertase Pin-like site-specific DNA recombinase
MALLGYARVSTTGQTLGAQRDQLTVAQCARIYQEIASGARADRPELQKLLAKIAAGDVLIVTRLDRLARSTIDLLLTLNAVVAKGARFKSLAEPWADTTIPAGRLMLTIIGGLAEFERHLIRDRTNEGRGRAKRAGVKFGPKCKLTAHQCQEVLARKAAGESVRTIARLYNVSQNTISRIRPRQARYPRNSQAELRAENAALLT